ncbi:MAG: hypothetical protein QOE71_3059 [Pseudonocardiales bacterium]|nr:hypothetical protein [Pseudonocardiales bacterium]
MSTLPGIPLTAQGRHDATVSGMPRLLSSARRFLALAALAGLLAMHGLSSDHDMPSLGSTHAAMAHDHAESLMTVIDDPASSAATDCAMCSMSHTECVATFRDTVELKSPTLTLTALPLAAGLSPGRVPSGASTEPAAGRAPPDVSLTRLCISRT